MFLSFVPTCPWGDVEFGPSGFAAIGIAENDNGVFSVSGTGDFNGDGFADVLIGTYRSPNYILYGDQMWVIMRAFCCRAFDEALVIELSASGSVLVLTVLVTFANCL